MWVPLDSSLIITSPLLSTADQLFIGPGLKKHRSKGIVCWRHRPGKKFLLHVISSINNSAQLPTICQSQSRGGQKIDSLHKSDRLLVQKEEKNLICHLFESLFVFPFLNSVWDFNMFLKSSADTFAAVCPGQMWGSELENVTDMTDISV